MFTSENICSLDFSSVKWFHLRPLSIICYNFSWWKKHMFIIKRIKEAGHPWLTTRYSGSREQEDPVRSQTGQIVLETLSQK
jgi:hypothetical protein